MQFSSPHANKVFLRLTQEKQKSIFDAAAFEFARHGYDGANTNAIARRAGVSVGSLFQYFRTKQALYLALVDYGTQFILLPVLDDIRDTPDAITLFRFMLSSAREFALSYPDYNRVYLGATAHMPGPMTTLLARRIEGRTIASYKRAMHKTREESGVREGCAAFLLDNLVLAYQFSFASPYYRERLIAYTGLDPQAAGDALCDALCELVKALL